MRTLLITLLVSAFIPSFASAQQAPVKPEDVKTPEAYRQQGFLIKPLKTFKDQEAMTTFARYSQVRGQAQQQQGVLAQLIQEKRQTFKELAARLKDRFNMDPNLGYRFDVKDNVLYSVEAETGKETNVLTLKEKNHIEELKRLMAGRSRVENIVLALNMVLQEKAQLVARIDERFKTEYGMDAKENYHLDTPSLTLFKVVPDPAAKKPAPPAKP